MISMEDLQQLADIYNSLLGISVKGQDAYLLVDAERTLFNFIKIKEQDIMRQQNNVVSEEQMKQEG